VNSLSVTKLALTVSGLLAVLIYPASAATVALTPNSSWNIFDVSDVLANSGGLEWIDINDGSALIFQFTATTQTLLSVVDGGFSGDQFQLSDNGVALGATSAAINSYPTSLGLNFDAAFASTNYSKGSYLLEAGTHSITGLLSLSAFDNTNTALNSTTGAVQLTAVPEPSFLWGQLGAFGLLALKLRRKSNQA
jgi:hypothetical protein